jgi:hypothetical protein
MAGFDARRWLNVVRENNSLREITCEIIREQLITALELAASIRLSGIVDYDRAKILLLIEALEKTI